MQDSSLWNKSFLRRWYRTRRWRLTLNLLLQPENDAKEWIQAHRIYHHCLVYTELVKIPELNKKMEQICIKISSGYCSKYEEESLILIPTPIKQLIGVTLFVEPSVFLAPPEYDSDEDGHFEKKQLQWKSKYLVGRCDVKDNFDPNEVEPIPIEIVD